jgi:uncharacterized protein YbbC (DUF1343 family)
VSPRFLRSRRLRAVLLALPFFVSPLLAQTSRATPTVRLGVDVLFDERLNLIEGKRVGLVAHPASVDSNLRATADRLAALRGVKLVRLFGPEHGVRGDVPAGDPVADAVDPKTGVPMFSLYGKTRRPTPESLADLDVVLFDLQDIGSRTYTYLATLGEVMRALSDAKKPLIVLDRPNPLGGRIVEGPIREERFTNFIAYGPVPLVHGLTAGETALFYRRAMNLACDVTVVPMKGWTRDATWPETGLTWTLTSPHIPRVLQAALYVPTGMVASSTKNLSDGVGSTMPFELIAAEAIDADRYVEALAAENLPGVRFQSVVVRPFYGAFAKKTLRGARLLLDDPNSFRPLRTAVALLVALERVHPGFAEFQDERTIGVHWGRADIPAFVRAGKSTAEIESSWAADVAAFLAAREHALLYPPR